jgi:hypothetical protein
LEVVLFKVENKEWRSADEYVSPGNKNPLQTGTVKLM